MNDRCEAKVATDWDRYDCNNRGKHERFGHRVCGTHAKQIDKWTEEGRGQNMAAYWWKWDAR